MVRTLRTNLRGHGFQVETAGTAGDAIASYERERERPGPVTTAL